MPLGWDIDLGWNQSATINIPSGSTMEVWLSTSLPNNAQPGEKGEFTLVATAQQDETKSDQIDNLQPFANHLLKIFGYL